MYERYRHTVIPAGLLLALAMLIPVFVLQQYGQSLIEAILTAVCVITPALTLAGAALVKFMSTQERIQQSPLAHLGPWSHHFWQWFAGSPTRRPGYDLLLLLILCWPVVLVVLASSFIALGWPTETAASTAKWLAVAIALLVIAGWWWKTRRSTQKKP
jgi:hypothetical protein